MSRNHVTTIPGKAGLVMTPPLSSVSTNFFLVVIVIAVLNSVLTGSMVNVLLPDMRETFGASPASISWVITAYSLMYAIGIPLVGRMSDVVGAQKLFSSGLAIFAFGSLISAIAPTLPFMVVGRLIQGGGGAVVPALAMVLISRTLPENGRGAAMGMVASAAGAGSAVGPFIGGWIGGSIGWRGLFLAPMLISLLILPLVRRAIPNSHGTSDSRFDIAGGVLLGLAIGLFLFGITQGQATGFGSFVPLTSFLGALVAINTFIWRIYTARNPFVPPALFRKAPYMRLVLTGLFSIMAYMSALVLVPLMLVENNGLAVSQAGLALTPGAIAVALGSRYAGRISDRIGPRIPIITGISILLLAALYLSTYAAGASAWVVASGMFFIGIGNSMINAPMNSAASRTLSEEETGIGMGLLAGFSFLGGGVGAAVIGAWLSIRQDAGTSALNPLHVNDAAAWSDGFLAVVVMSIIALMIATTISRSEVQR